MKIILLLLAIILSASCITPAEAINNQEAEMNYFSFGRGKKTLVIIPGLSVQSILLFEDIIKKSYEIFSEDFTVYVIDRKEKIPNSISEMAEDTAQVLREIRNNTQDFHIFGASQGGMIAMEIAIKYPELVRSMVLGSTSAAAHSELGTETALEAETGIEVGVIDKWIKLAEAGSTAALYQSFGEMLYNQKIDEAAAREAAKTVTTEDLRRFIIQAKAIKEFNILGELEKIKCPVLVIGSEDDRVLGPEASRLIAENIPHSELFMYDGYGHAAYDTAPDYRERMKKFFDEH